MRYDEKENTDGPLKPVIKEMVRTGYCREDVVLLVDKITILHIVSSDDSTPTKAYRLFLTDREKTIQALFKRRTHKRLSRGEIREGSYVALKDYALSQERRFNGNGNVLYLAVSDFAWMGDDRQYKRREAEHDNSGVIEGQKEAKFVNDHASTLETATPLTTEPNFSHNTFDHPPEGEQPLDANPENSYASSNSHDTVIRRASPELAAAKSDNFHETRSQNHADEHHQGSREARNEKFGSHAATSALSQTNMSTAPKGPEYKPLKPTNHTLELSTLASVTGSNRSRNKVVNVLAIVSFVEGFTVKRPKMPLKRDIGITDTSTEKKVTLSNFVNPTEWVPTVGDIVLFRNMVTHDYNGGNLNAYPNQCEGKEWHILNPYSTEGRPLSLEETRLKILTDTENDFALK